MANEAKWGGPRENSGRPTIGNQPRKTTSITIDPGLLDAIDQLAKEGNTSRSEIINQLLTEALAY